MNELQQELALDRPLKVLVADDNFAGRQLLSRLIGQLVHVRITEARTGLEAIEAFRLGQPDITFLDIDMPEMDGLQALQNIRETTPDAFVVMVSAMSSARTVQQALSLGVSGFIVKPYSGHRLIGILKRYAAAARGTTT